MALVKHCFVIACIAPILFFFTLCATANAVTREEVAAGAENLYRARLLEAQQRHELDNDQTFLVRVRNIAAGLIAEARREHPLAAELDWEIHITSAYEESASCMAGGKLLIGQNYVTELGLDDAELAMLLSHEIQHAVLEHNLKEFQEALKLEPERQRRPFPELEYAIDHDETLMSKLSEFNAAQESEADREGLLMAWRAGWPARKLADYFKKLARADPMPNFDSREHPAAARRWKAARELAEQIDRTDAPAASDK